MRAGAEGCPCVSGGGEAEISPQRELFKEKDESQKLQARTLDGNTAPHCKHVFVTGEFCAADARTPVRSEPEQNTTEEKTRKRELEGMFRISHQEFTGYGPRQWLKCRFVVRACRG